MRILTTLLSVLTLTLVGLPATAADLEVPVGKSSVVALDTRASDIAIGDPEVIDVKPLPGNKLRVLGRAAGRTDLQVFAGDGRKLIERQVAVVRPASDKAVHLHRPGGNGLRHRVIWCAPRCGQGTPAITRQFGGTGQ